MNIVNEYEEEGYKIIEYNNGTIVKELILETSEEEVKILSKEELDNLELREKLDYTITLLELERGILNV